MANIKKLQANGTFADSIALALGIIDEKQASLDLGQEFVDKDLYSNFWTDYDKRLLEDVRSHPPATLADLLPKMKSKRMRKLLPLYKARNYPSMLTPEEYDAFETYRSRKLLTGGENSAYARFAQRLQKLAVEKNDDRTHYLLTELQLYAESIIPAIS